MEIRKARPSEIDRLMEIYAGARAFMASTGNATQWGDSWPPRNMIEKDIADGKSYVCAEGDDILAVFFYDYGKDAEPAYKIIHDGSWISDEPYGVVHRIAVASQGRGVGRVCLDWAYNKSGTLRIDTHTDNTVMQRTLKGLGFSYRGMVDVAEDNVPRMAFEKV